MIRAGFSAVDITPETGLRMEGMLSPPEGTGVQYPLRGRAAVFDDGIDRAAIVSLDLLFLMPVVVAEFRQAVTAGTGLRPENVMIACTHTHRAPYVTALMDDDTLVRSAFQNSGQICLCGSRILVERAVNAEFRDAFVKKGRFSEALASIRVEIVLDPAAPLTGATHVAFARWEGEGRTALPWGA